MLVSAEPQRGISQFVPDQEIFSAVLRRQKPGTLRLLDGGLTY